MRSVVPFEAGHAGMKQWLGGKGANLAEMTKVGLPVPPGFTITTEVCRAYYAAGGQLPKGLMDEVAQALKQLESAKGQRFGDPQNPLLVSVRSGSVTSMPGMMDTILNLGMNDETVRGLAALTGNPRFAYDCYRRLIQMFGNVVFDLESYHFEGLLHRLKQQTGAEYDSQVSAEGWMRLIEEYKAVVLKETGRPFPQKVEEQLELAVEAVFRSWNNARAKVYRKVHHIPDEQGTAVNIQSMVFGNMGSDCGTGVVFTRNPSTGEKSLYGEYLMNAQGEDVVAGVRTPVPIAELKNDMPEVFDQLLSTAEALELHYKDMQDIEFTVERGKLYLLQTRDGKRTAQAAVKIAVDLVHERILERGEAIERIEPFHLDQLLHRAIDTDKPLDVLAVGLPASPGAATGAAVFDADTAESWAREGRKVILIRTETTPEDIHGVLAAEGVLTSRGGMTSHAAVVARGMGKPCVCGCESIRIEDRIFSVEVDGKLRIVREGDDISIDGASGRVILGGVSLREPVITAELQQLLGWADSIRKLQIYTNADTPDDAAKARSFGAEGIGLCRTEHMFMSAERVPVVQEMILAETEEERSKALAQLLPMQQEDFAGIFKAMSGLPVTIRLLDPPLHEFLPNLEQLIVQQERLRYQPDADPAELEQLDKLLRKVRALHEMNPMLGTRGCRLGLVLPEIYEMQVEAVFRAALSCLNEQVEARPDIMIPLVGHANELKRMRELVERKAEEVLGDAARTFRYRIGTMIEVPRAAVTAAQIAAHADFFSFGTNDLTQMTFGYSRDDAEGKFLTHYVESNLLPDNPFQVLDRDGVGRLIEWAVEQGKSVKPQLKTSICGEHGGDKQSIFFCHAVGLDYVSCSPYRVPLARIAAAQAQLALGKAQKNEETGLIPERSA
ncbi:MULTISPECIES: pyruvate, phosphate dikinase [Paenibacillus]|uniref:Pyruvate, phosphate dikinase n=1 Tax=Paenibacillus naphthalenovorans TaxID=162209 RepID=A0A0U2VHJ1_9BACL|nr:MULTISPECIES: pyruvate, phosphate dikinase [Paenibacillus]ALS22915.1 pyruvate phosphate dikinase [Paenibacillus naphthalenovorans]NTZ17486.1 pyruvate, phosphate dikinase [Paenibacillus sp. JMULE4]